MFNKKSLFLVFTTILALVINCCYFSIFAVTTSNPYAILKEPPILLEDGKSVKIYDSLSGKKISQINLTKEQYLPLYDQNGFNGGYAVIHDTKNGAKIIDMYGKTTFKPKLKTYGLESLGGDCFAYSYYVNYDEYTSLIDHTGKTIIKGGVYDSYKVENLLLNRYSKGTFIIAEKNNKKVILNNKGEILLNKTFSSINLNQQERDLAYIIADGDFYLLALGKKDPIIFEKGIVYEPYIGKDTYNNDYYFVKTGASNNLLYIVKNNKATVVGEYRYQTESNKRYVLLQKKDDSYDLYDTKNMKLIKGLAYNEYNKLLTANDDSPIIAYKSPGKEISVVTPFFNGAYNNVSHISLLRNGYYVTKSYYNDDNTFDYTIYNELGSKVLTINKLHKPLHNEYGEPYLALKTADGLSFICGQYDDPEYDPPFLLSSTGKVLLSSPTIQQLTTMGNCIVATNDKELHSLYKTNGTLILKDVKIDGRVFQKVNSSFKLDGLGNNEYNFITINNKMGLYDFTNFKWVIQPNYKDEFFIHEGCIKAVDFNNKTHYFTFTGIELK